MDQFSRHLNVQNYKNAVEIAKELKAKFHQFTHGSSLIKLSPSQELEDTRSFKRVWMKSSTGKITSTLTSPTLSILRDSSRPPRESLLVTTPNIRMVNSMTPLTTIQDLRMTKIPFTSDQFKQIRLLSIQITYLSLINIVYTL